MNQSPNGHPPQDMLADLAAGVLSPDQARTVEAHVRACPVCEQLLVNAERVRGLFHTPPPGPMPADVWAQVERTLTAEAAGYGVTGGAVHGPSAGQGGPGTTGWFDIPGQNGHQAFPSAPIPLAAAPMTPPALQPPMAQPPVTPPSPYPQPYVIPPPGAPARPGGQVQPVPEGSATPDTGSMFLPKPGENRPGVPVPPPEMSFDEAPTAAWRIFLNEPEPEPPSDPVERKKAGRSVRSMRSRRDVRSDTESIPLWRRPRARAGAAAAGVLLLSLGGVGLVKLLNAGDTEARSAADAMPGANGRSIVRNSGTQYTAGTLAAQVTALMKASASASPSTASATGPSPAASASAGAGTVADPKQLQACLAALGEQTRKPVAVDLASYQGREAAVIVLPGLTSGFDVWVVARDCRPGAEGHLAYKAIPG
jgi:hypothetical protein